MAQIFKQALDTVKDFVTDEAKRTVKQLGDNIHLKKIRMGYPLRLNQFDVSFAGTLTPPGVLSRSVYSFEVDAQRYDVRAHPMGPFKFPLFVGIRDEMFTFQVQFLENRYGDVNSFWENYFNSLVSQNGTLSEVYPYLMDVKVHQLDNNTQRKITYEYKDCVFIEEGTLTFQHDSTEVHLITIRGYAMKFVKTFGGFSTTGQRIFSQVLGTATRRATRAARVGIGNVL
jgi:hypothetical protein